LCLLYSRKQQPRFADVRATLRVARKVAGDFQRIAGSPGAPETTLCWPLRSMAGFVLASCIVGLRSIL